MTDNIYVMSDNSFFTRGFPWGADVLIGRHLDKVCHTCDERQFWAFRGELVVELEPRKGTRWPDALGNAWLVRIVSRRVIDDWAVAGVTGVVDGPVRLADPLPKRLRDVPPPEYRWLDGARMAGGEFDHEASGYVDVRFCPDCGGVHCDVSATHRRQREEDWPPSVVRSTWNGADLFTTRLNPRRIFCTQKVVDCAKRNKHLNFQFEPARFV